jgi:hypothetical protein
LFGELDSISMVLGELLLIWTESPTTDLS